MQTFYVLWAYNGNSSDLLPVYAETAEEALQIGTGGLEFRERATVYVFDVPPALIVHKGERYPKKEHTSARACCATGDRVFRTGFCSEKCESVSKPACDYEPCGECGYDHSYEPEEALRAHTEKNSNV